LAQKTPKYSNNANFPDTKILPATPQKLKIIPPHQPGNNILSNVTD